MIPVQEVYFIGLALHNRITSKNINYARSPEEFKKIWEEAIAEVKAEFPRSDIDWRFRP